MLRLTKHGTNISTYDHRHVVGGGGWTRYAFAYTGNILIAFHIETDHEQHVCTVFKQLQEYGISVNSAKCVFVSISLTFLGHVLDKDFCRPNLNRVTAIQSLSLLFGNEERFSTSFGLCKFLLQVYTRNNGTASHVVRLHCGSQKAWRTFTVNQCHSRCF